MRVNHCYDFTVTEFPKSADYRLIKSRVGEAIYSAGRILTTPFAWEASNTTKLFVRATPGISATKGAMASSALRTIALVVGLVPSVACAILGYPLRVIGSLFKDGMALIESPLTSFKRYRKDEGLHIMTSNVGLMPEAIRNINDLRSSYECAGHMVKLINEQPTAAQPDIICFQEGFDMDATHILCDGLRPSYHHILHSVAPSEIGLGSGLVVASKYPIIEARYRPFKDLAAEDAFANKGLLRIVVNLGNGQTAVLYNTHLQAKGGPIYSAIRSQEIAQIRSWVEEDTRSDKRDHLGIFLAGDFNVSHRIDTGKESVEYAVAKKVLSKAFVDPYYKDHDPETGKRTKNTARFLPADITTEPLGTFYEGSNQTGNNRGTWGQRTWHLVCPAVERCIYDHQFIYDPSELDRFDTHSEIRQFVDNEAPSGLSDHLPLSVIYKEKE